MMQVTGNNITQNRDLSILIRTDGLSFYVPTEGKYNVAKTIQISEVNDKLENVLSTLKNEYNLLERAKVIISTDKSVVIPTELFLKENVNSYFSLKGVEIDFEKDYIISSQNELCTYLWLYNRNVIDIINTCFNEVRFVHILEISQLIGERLCFKFKNSVFLANKENNLLSFAIFQNQTMVFQETIETNTPSDTVFYIKAILSNYGFKRKDNLVVLGEKNENLAKILLNFSKTVSVIDYFESF